MKILPDDLALIRDGLARMLHVAIRHRDKTKESNILQLVNRLDRMEAEFYEKQPDKQSSKESVR